MGKVWSAWTSWVFGSFTYNTFVDPTRRHGWFFLVFSTRNPVAICHPPFDLDHAFTLTNILPKWLNKIVFLFGCEFKKYIYSIYVNIYIYTRYNIFIYIYTGNLEQLNHLPTYLDFP